MQLNRHRFAAHLPTENEPEDPDQDSFNPISVTVKVHARPVPGTVPSEDEKNPEAQVSHDMEPNASDESLGRNKANGDGPELPGPKLPDPKLPDPSGREVPDHLTLSRMVDRENSGFLKYVIEFVKASFGCLCEVIQGLKLY